MSQANVGVFRRAIAAYAADDWTTLWELTHRDVTLRPAEGLGRGVFINAASRVALKFWRDPLDDS